MSLRLIAGVTNVQAIPNFFDTRHIAGQAQVTLNDQEQALFSLIPS